MVKLVANFAERLNCVMEMYEITSVELAREINIRESTISQYRTGYVKPRVERLEVISNALHVNPAWLLGFNVPMEV